MTDARTPRTLIIPDHIWSAYAQMANEMGNDREGLITQALFAFARQNGYVVPGSTRAGIPPPQSDPAAPPPVQPREPPQAPPLIRRLTPGAVARVPAQASSAPPPTMLLDADSAMRSAPPPRAANAERVAELERQLAVAPPPQRPSTPPPVQDGSVQVDDSLLGDDEQHATSMDMPSLEALGLGDIRKQRAAMHAARAAAQVLPPEPPEQTPMPGDPGVAGQHGKVLVLLADGREIDRVVKERFLIGRGKHCDLIINSGKVSREHAAITREGNDYFIEDLGSSNGTWFEKRRISRRQIQEGDEYFVCAERLTCAFR